VRGLLAPLVLAAHRRGRLVNDREPDYFWLLIALLVVAIVAVVVLSRSLF
jgi:hypothetical protein